MSEAMPTGRERPGEHWNARIIREEAEAARAKAYKPQKGDRVRVTVEGEVVWENDLWAHIHTTDGLVSTSLRLRKEEGLTIEKLADPEPTWVNGDVIKVVFRGCGPGFPRGPRRAVHVNGRWIMTDTGETAGIHFMTNHWPENVEILYKQDAP